ncbi:hypothetical protein EMIT0P395_210003 [Pseudomonas sp. IT-P395]
MALFESILSVEGISARSLASYLVNPMDRN